VPLAYLWDWWSPSYLVDNLCREHPGVTLVLLALAEIAVDLGHIRGNRNMDHDILARYIHMATAVDKTSHRGLVEHILKTLVDSVVVLQDILHQDLVFDDLRM
jgi:hypothetical protein